MLGLLGAFVALWATFAPCFLWIFAGAPYIEWMTRQPRLEGALKAITAAVVGVIFNLAALVRPACLLRQGHPHRMGAARPVDAARSRPCDWRVVVLAGLSAFLLLRRHWSILSVLALSAVLWRWGCAICSS